MCLIFLPLVSPGARRTASGVSRHESEFLETKLNFCWALSRVRRSIVVKCEKLLFSVSTRARGEDALGGRELPGTAPHFGPSGGTKGLHLWLNRRKLQPSFIVTSHKDCLHHLCSCLPSAIDGDKK